MVCLDTRAREKYQWNRIDRSIDRWKTPDTLRLPLVERLRAGALLSFLVNQRSFVIPEGRLGKPHNYRHHRALHTGNRYQVVYYVERMRACHWLVQNNVLLHGSTPFVRTPPFICTFSRSACMSIVVSYGCWNLYRGGGDEMFYSRNKICLTQSYRMTSRSRMKLLWHF